MLPQNFASISAKEQERLGLPPGFKLASPYPFGGMNQSASRMGMPDNDFFYIENLIKLGDGNLRALWDKGSPIFITPGGKTIVSFFFYNIGPTNYAVAFLSDGTAIQVNYLTQAQTVISSAVGTFYIGGQLPCYSQWGSQYLLIANNINANAYWVWDGAVLYTAGTLSPLITITDGGVNYTSAPTVTAYGGSGSGATFSATISGGSVVSVVPVNPGTGYEPGDQPQLAFSGGGSDSSAILEANLDSQVVASVTITNPGTGYTPGTYALTFFGGGGTGAAGNYTVGSGGTVTSAQITSAGSGYEATPIVSFTSGGGSGAAGVAVLNPGSVVSVTIVNGGTGFTSTPILTVVGGGGSGATLVAQLGTETVLSITVATPGSGITPGTYALTFSGGGGTGAAGTYTVGVGGTVTSTAITNGGSGYTSAPTVTFTHGGGTPATGTANMSAAMAGVITGVTVTNFGSGYTSTPSIVVTPGANNAAAATVDLMPYGISGSSMETFLSRVWLCFPYKSGSQQTGGVFNVSAPGSFSDFATNDGAVTFTSTDSFLRYQYTNIKQTNGYIYPMGDSSVSVVSNVQTQGTPATTTFNYQNTDPQIGTSWRDSCAPYSRTILFGNPFGIYGLYGGAVTKVSAIIDQVFTNGVFTSLTPTSAVANIYSKKVYMTLMQITDPVTQTVEKKLVCWDEKDWFFASQSLNLIYIGTQEISSDIAAWGTDGAALYPLFAVPSTAIQKKIITKLYGTQESVIKKRTYTFMVQCQDLSTAHTGIVMDVNIDTNYLNPETNAYSYPLPRQIQFAANQPTYPVYSAWSGDVYGMNIGATVISTSPDFTVNYLAIGYDNYVGELSLAGG